MLPYIYSNTEEKDTRAKYADLSIIVSIMTCGGLPRSVSGYLLHLSSLNNFSLAPTLILTWLELNIEAKNFDVTN